VCCDTCIFVENLFFKLIGLRVVRVRWWYLDVLCQLFVGLSNVVSPLLESEEIIVLRFAGRPWWECYSMSTAVYEYVRGGCGIILQFMVR
jgi:hypothetical protein